MSPSDAASEPVAPTGLEGVDYLGWLPEEWSAWARSVGEPAYRGRQIFEWLHRHLAAEPAAMSSLPESLRAHLTAAGVGWPWRLSVESKSDDGTRKLLLEPHNGDPKARIETVLLPEQLVNFEDDPYTGGLRKESDAVSQCISSQVGCAMGCVFCASGALGLTRHLSAGEIVAQTSLGRVQLEAPQHLRRLVYMGMGEPLHNYEQTARSIRVLTHPWGFALGARRITISTSGLVPKIDALAQDFEGHVHLAVSLHAADNETRTKILPINQRYPLEDLYACLKRYPLRRRRWITIEYTLIEGINDGLADARALARWLRGLCVKVNLIPLNPVDHVPLKAPSPARVHAFQRQLMDAGYSVYVRKQRGDDIDAACGQLAMRAAPARPARPAATARRLALL